MVIRVLQISGTTAPAVYSGTEFFADTAPTSFRPGGSQPQDRLDAAGTAVANRLAHPGFEANTPRHAAPLPQATLVYSNHARVRSARFRTAINRPSLPTIANDTDAIIFSIMCAPRGDREYADPARRGIRGNIER